MRMNIILLICLALLISACGTKGPLYIPEQRYPQQAEKPAALGNMYQQPHLTTAKIATLPANSQQFASA